jgi:hypothetical protein
MSIEAGGRYYITYPKREALVHVMKLNSDGSCDIKEIETGRTKRVQTDRLHHWENRP